MPFTLRRILRLRLVLLLQPLLQLRATLCQFGFYFWGIATRLAVFNLTMNRHQCIFVRLDIPGHGFDLCCAQMQGLGNIGMGPPGFEVVQNIPDGDPCS